MRLLTAFDEEYPRPLARDRRPAAASSSRSGSLERLRLPAVAVVGSRDASRYGRDVAWRPGAGALAARRRGRFGFRARRRRRRARGGARGPGRNDRASSDAAWTSTIRASTRALKEGSRAERPAALGVPARAPSRGRRIFRSATASSRDSARGRRRRGVAAIGLSDHGAARRGLRARRVRRAGLVFSETSLGSARAPARRRDPLPRRRGRPRGALPLGRRAAARRVRRRPARRRSSRRRPGASARPSREEDAVGRGARAGTRPAGRDRARRASSSSRARGSRCASRGVGAALTERSEALEVGSGRGVSLAADFVDRNLRRAAGIAIVLRTGATLGLRFASAL